MCLFLCTCIVIGMTYMEATWLWHTLIGSAIL
nr:MAG TPA: hypothetical protein [Caudoviricetes sp.]